MIIYCIGGLIHLQDGFKNRFPATEGASTQELEAMPELGNCFLSTDESYDDWTGGRCFLGDKEEDRANTSLWGDSHANHLVYGIHKKNVRYKVRS